MDPQALLEPTLLALLHLDFVMAIFSPVDGLATGFVLREQAFLLWAVVEVFEHRAEAGPVCLASKASA